MRKQIFLGSITTSIEQCNWLNKIQSMANSKRRDEPVAAPPVDHWFDLTLGSSFQDNPSSKFCTLRYEFKPASIDKNQPAKLHKSKDNKVSIEFQNNQQGKPKVSFEGSIEDYKDNDAVLFFDGTSFRLERLHRSVKRLRHVRQPGESAAGAATTLPVPPPESSSPPLGKGPKMQPSNKSLLPPSVEVERIEIGNFKGFDGKAREERVIDNPSVPSNSFYASPGPKPDDDLDEQLDILNDDDDEIDIGGTDNMETVLPERQPFTGIDINIPHQNESDDEIAEVDVSDDDGDGVSNAAEALRAQLNAEERKEPSSSSGASSGSDSGSNGSDSESSEGRLQKDEMVVDCGDQGVVFVEAKIAGCGISDFIQNPKYETQKSLFPEGFLWKESCLNSSFLAVQVTSFEGGGMTVTVSISHKVADGCTIATFLSDWAAVARGEVRPTPMILAHYVPSLDLEVKVPEIVLNQSKTCVTKRYTFDAKTIDRLKNCVSGLVENPTKVEVVTAHLYKCAITASIAKMGVLRNSIWIQLVNMRPRMKKPLPENSIGNFTWYFTVSNNEREKSLSNLVAELKKGIKELCSGGDSLDLSTWMMEVGESASRVKGLFDDLDVYRCSSMCKRPFYQVDFGWGCPKWVTMADVLVKNTFVLFDRPDGDGIEAMVSLEEEDMSFFQMML